MDKTGQDGGVLPVARAKLIFARITVLIRIGQ